MVEQIGLTIEDNLHMNGGPFTYYVITDGGGGLKNHKIPFILDREIGGGGRKILKL